MIVNGIRLSASDVARLKNSAKVAQKIETTWDYKIRREIDAGAKLDADRISAGGELSPPDFERLFIEHYFDTQIQALTLAEKETELDTKRLAKQPRTLKQIMDLYDRWRKGLFTPKGPARQAQSIKKAYIAAINATWKAFSYDFRNGGEDVQADIVKQVREAGKSTIPRAQTIVRTETTRYYNDARRAYYDKGGDVTHYLFLAVRDKATTPWCTSQKVDGKRGRSGLVYAKDDPLLDAETPPVHWNCRSELLPLNRFNPAHRKLIADPAMQRRNHVCHALPPGWNK